MASDPAGGGTELEERHRPPGGIPFNVQVCNTCEDL